MRTFPRLLVLFLGLTTATSVFYAYQQRQSLRVARLAAESLERERAELRERLRRAELAGGRTTTTADLPGANASTAAGALETDLPAVGNTPAPAEMIAGGGRLPQFLETPEAQRLLAVQQRAALDQRYGALFRLLNLPPDQLNRLKDLLVERQTAAMDVLAAARSQGLNNRENRAEIRSLLESTQDEVDANIRALLGETGYQRYEYYNATQPQRTAVNRLEQRLSYTSLPLSVSQSEQLVQLLAAQSPSSAGNTAAARPARAMFFGGGQGTVISDEVVAQAATILNPAQMEALRQLQAEQQAQAELGQLLRESRRNRGNRSGESGPPPATPSPATPPRG